MRHRPKVEKGVIGRSDWPNRLVVEGEVGRPLADLRCPDDPFPAPVFEGMREARWTHRSKLVTPAVLNTAQAEKVEGNPHPGKPSDVVTLQVIQKVLADPTC
jgi:hypothetical protein